jgi:vacuolar-type H+-ATPase subunit E/Vma4
LRIAINLTSPFSTNNQVAFIKQEALEKAREIKVKADEEFAIEKVVVTVEWDAISTDGLLRFIGEAR